MRLVLIHGFTGGPASWDGVVAALEPKTAPLRVTLLGHGKLPGPPATTFDAEVDRVAAGLRQEGLTAEAPGHVVGYSLGARIALGLLARHGGLFAAATLIGGRLGLADPAERAARITQDRRWIELLEEELGQLEREDKPWIRDLVARIVAFARRAGTDAVVFAWAF